MLKAQDRSLSSGGRSSAISATRLIMLITVLATASVSAAPTLRRITIGNNGKLEGAANGWAWVFPSRGATITTPQPCDKTGCFKDTGGRLCTKGSIQALACTGKGTPQHKCNWEENWGMVLGFNTHEPAGAWGAAAPGKVAVHYSSVAQAGSAGHFRLNAHVAGTPYSKQYCVDNYTPGAVVQPQDMKTECWFGTGESLSSFQSVDTIALLRVSENVPVAFDFCVSAIEVE
jgi:hypothetical protein